MNKTPTTLIIMDGIGIGPDNQGNAFTHAATPVLDRLFAENPFSRLSASVSSAHSHCARYLSRGSWRERRW